MTSFSTNSKRRFPILAKSLIATALVLIALWIIGQREIANGEKVGVFTKIAQQGRVVKTWEGELIRGGMQGGNGVNGSAFYFTVDNDALAARIQRAMEAGQEVKIVYRREWFTFFRSESSNFFVSDFVVIHPKVNGVLVGHRTSEGKASLESMSEADRDEVLRLLQVQGELLKVQAELLGRLAH